VSADRYKKSGTDRGTSCRQLGGKETKTPLLRPQCTCGKRKREEDRGRGPDSEKNSATRVSKVCGTAGEKGKLQEEEGQGILLKISVWMVYQK